MHLIFKNINATITVGILLMVFLKLISEASASDELKSKICSFTEKITPDKDSLSLDVANIDHVKSTIKDMYLLDQDVRQSFIHDLDNDEVKHLISKMDECHTSKLKPILLRHGWITISIFGSEADNQTWLLVQHADHDPFFQQSCLFILSELVNKKETSPKNYAYLYDRVALKLQSLGMKQRFGTQVNISDDEIKLLPYEGSIEDVNQKRIEVGLETTVEEYLELIKKVYLK